MYLLGKDDTLKGVCFSPQKHKLLADIANSLENQGCIMKKVKSNEDTSDFMSTDYTTITQSKLGYEKDRHNFGYISVIR